MAIRSLPDTALLRKLVSYEPDTGAFIWLPRTPDMFRETNGRYSRAVACRTWNTKNAGKPAFCNPHGKNHLSGAIFGEIYLAHRIAWALHHGERMFGIIDHIDGDGTNNRISNLRMANRQMNAQNARRRHDCTSGVTGVHWHINKRWGKPCWTARIQVGRKRIFLGSFESLDEAIVVRREAEKRYGFGPVHGVKKDA